MQIPLCLFCFVHLLLSRGPTLVCLIYPVKFHWWKHFFSFASRYQLCVGCWLSLRLCSLFPLRIGTSGLNMCSSYSCCCHLWIHMCIRSVLSARHCFQESALLLLALRVCLCPLLNSSCALRRACDGHIPGSAK